jgi:hypothetical protein
VWFHFCAFSTPAYHAAFKICNFDAKFFLENLGLCAGTCLGKNASYQNLQETPKSDYNLLINERRGRAVNTPTSYSGGPAFDSRSRGPAILIQGFRGFPQSLQANAGIVP